MSSLRPHTFRHRSRSTSNTSPLCRRSPNNSFKIATKRAHPMPTFSPANSNASPEKWDVDMWRRGKRRRCDMSLSDTGMGSVHNSDEDGQETYLPAVPVRKPLPASSAAFNISPKSKSVGHQHRSRRASYSLSRSGAASRAQDGKSHPELSKLRSNAFGELHRSVAENGEGFVERMRDYERIRSKQIFDLSCRGRRHTFTSQPSWRPPFAQDSDVSDNDDDVQIFAQDVPESLLVRTSEHSKRGTSADGGNMYNFNFGFSEKSIHAPLAVPCNLLSSYHSEGDGQAIPVNSGSSPSPSSCSFSSTVSSSSPSPVTLNHRSSDDADCSGFLLSPSLLIPAFNDPSLPLASEKAVSELSLAMANGAGSINDYGYLQNIAVPESAGDGDPGELWH